MQQTLLLTDPNQRAATVKNQDITEISVDCWKKSENTENTQNNPGNKNSDASNSNPNSNLNNNNNNHNNYKNSNGAERKPETVYLPYETCGKTNHSAERCYVGANAANRPLPWKSKPEEQSGHHQQDAQNSITGYVLARAQHLN